MQNKFFFIRGIIIGFVLLLSSLVQAQTKGYFQQKLSYKIKVELDDVNHFLYGQEEVVYVNNSTEELSFLWFHLWPNAYKNEETALCEQMVRNGNTDLYYADDSLRGYIDSIAFKVDGKVVKWDLDSKHIDICKILLNSPLHPGDSILISTPFRVKIPSAEFSRLGHLGKSYMITQWYPKPAVYDNKGWHPIPYLNQGEFYSEFGDFDVTITLPKTYVVGASGNLFEEAKDSISDTDSNIVEKEVEVENSLTKTLRYTISNVHDFAWFADKRFKMKRKTITLPSGHEVKLTALFLYEDADEWKKALTSMEQGVKFYSRHIAEYPYDVCTTVDGALAAGGGMEYPTITVIGQTGSGIMNETTIVHEIGHNWFYGILGFNERDYPWMDEGINTFYQSLYEEKYYGDKSLIEMYSGQENPQLRRLGISPMAQYYYPYVFMARHHLDQSLALTSEEYTSTNYGSMVYNKSVLIFRYLRDYLGVQDFDTLMHGFYSAWKFKHPQPEDFVAYFTQNSPKDIGWFFNDILFSTHQIDYAISGVKTIGDSIRIKVKNKGDVSVPFSISGIDKYGIVQQTQWYAGFPKKGEVYLPKGSFDKIKIDASEQMPEVNRNNNSAKVNGAFRTMNPKRLKLLYSVPFKGTDDLYFFPALGWNAYSGFMLGAAIYSDPVLERKWEFTVVPLYAFGSKQLNGEVGLYRNFHTNGFIRKWSIGITGRKYDYDISEAAGQVIATNKLYFYKTSPEIRFYFRTPANISTIKHQLSFRWLDIHRQNVFYSLCGNSNSYEPNVDFLVYGLGVVSYKYINNRKINPYGFNAEFQVNNDITKAWFSADYSLSFKKNKSFDIRFFAGNIFSYNSNTNVDYSFKLSNWSGNDDYLFDYTYAARSQNIGGGLLSAQMTPVEGGFSIYTPLGRSWSWLSAVNLKTSLPFTNLIRLYADFGIYPDGLNNNKPKMLYEGGAYLNIIPHYLEVYFPVFWSKEIQDVAELNNKAFYEQKIRFTFRMDLMNPFKMLREIEL